MTFVLAFDGIPCREIARTAISRESWEEERERGEGRG
jgi:hypothetical protein|tara:strand:- start:6204 stop:6314 length:111 start_codon:yes stop_codon:yes gene_type:complete